MAAHVGWAGIGLKTLVGNDEDGRCSLAERSRKVFFAPDKRFLSQTRFLSGERGSELDVDTYVREVLRDSLAVGEEAGILVKPSFTCGRPFEEHVAEWHYTIRRLSEMQQRAMETDFSPDYAYPPPDTFEELEEIQNEYVRTVVGITAFCQEFAAETVGPGVVVAPKLNSAMFPVMRVLLSVLAEHGVAKGFVGFNRPFGAYIDPFSLVALRSAYGGENHKIANINLFREIYSNGDFGLPASATGGCVTGFDAVEYISSGEIGSIQVVSQCYYQGQENVLKRLLGGFVVAMVHLNRTCPDKYGFEVVSVADLKRKSHHPAVAGAFRAVYPSETRRFRAEIDQTKCKHCREKSPIHPHTVCRALLVCPYRAIETVDPEQGIFRVNPDLCAGCGTCLPCDAIHMTDRAADRM